ncbi:MAG TPA: bifunctional hydroxymethylpyrimidine kinase/phosphomethylpyrimidine kinase [Vicinamibacterales bacterium]|nr:bifunctional hydroxymethylpyrimidine kinase/phosphomethylpyrimidine kinase [Vicinamibacterales bacterium]
MRVALTIAGSDSSAGAGIQADLKTFAAHGVFGVSAITAVTAQNTTGVIASAAMPADLVTSQIEAVVSDIGVHAAKTGMLANAAVVEAVSAAVADLEIPFLVVDPVITASSGDLLLDDEGLLAMKKELLARAHVVTPNILEAELLSGTRIRTEDDRREAARRIFALGPAYVVITGGHAPAGWGPAPLSDEARRAKPEAGSADRIVDLVYDGEVFTDYATDRVGGRHTHGTGCAFSASLAAQLALGRSVHEAVPIAQAYVAGAIRHAPGLGRGAGPMNHFWRLDSDKAGRL